MVLRKFIHIFELLLNLNLLAMSQDKKQPFFTSPEVIHKLHIERRFNATFKDFDDLKQDYEDGKVFPLFHGEEEQEPYDIVISRMYDMVRDLRNDIMERFQE